MTYSPLEQATKALIASFGTEVFNWTIEANDQILNVKVLLQRWDPKLRSHFKIMTLTHHFEAKQEGAFLSELYHLLSRTLSEDLSSWSTKALNLALSPSEYPRSQRFGYAEEEL